MNRLGRFFTHLDIPEHSPQGTWSGCLSPSASGAFGTHDWCSLWWGRVGERGIRRGAVFRVQRRKPAKEISRRVTSAWCDEVASLPEGTDGVLPALGRSLTPFRRGPRRQVVVNSQKVYGVLNVCVCHREKCQPSRCAVEQVLDPAQYTLVFYPGSMSQRRRLLSDS